MIYFVLFTILGIFIHTFSETELRSLLISPSTENVLVSRLTVKYPTSTDPVILLSDFPR